MSNNDIVPGFDDEKDENLDISLEKESEDFLIILLSGYIDTYNSGIFEKKIKKAIASGYNLLVFECSKLNNISSSGIGSFSFFLKDVRSRCGEIAICGIQPGVYDTFRLLGFAGVFVFKETIKESIEYINNDLTGSAKPDFPVNADCPACGIKIEAAGAGRFRCSGCEAILSVDVRGNITLG